MNGELLVALMAVHEVMVTRRSYDILELEDGAVGDVRPT